MKAIKLILLFTVILGCIIGFFFLTGGRDNEDLYINDANQIQKYSNDCIKACQRKQEVTTEKPTTPDPIPTPKVQENDTIVTTIESDTTNTNEESADVQEETTKEETTKNNKDTQTVSKSSSVSTNQAANTKVEPVDQTFKCSMCGESFNTDKERKRHERSQCQKLIQCETCGFKFRPAEFEAHKKTCKKLER